GSAGAAPARSCAPSTQDDDGMLGGEPEYALTLWQPWASAIVLGPKRVENRPWAPPSKVLGKRIWIHAGLAYDGDRHGAVARLWPWLDETADGRFRNAHYLPRGAVIGSALVAGYGQASADEASGNVCHRIVGSATDAI